MCVEDDSPHLARLGFHYLSHFAGSVAVGCDGGQVFIIGKCIKVVL